MSCNRKKDDHRHFAVEATGVTVSVKMEPRSHESRPTAVCPAEVIGRKHAVVDALERDTDIWVGHEFSLLNSRVYISSRGQTRCDLSKALAFCRTEGLWTIHANENSRVDIGYGYWIITAHASNRPAGRRSEKFRATLVGCGSSGRIGFRPYLVG